MARPFRYLSIILLHLLFLTSHRSLVSAAGGRWQFLRRSIGISAMHMQLLKNDRVVIYDRTDFGRSNISLARGKCKNDIFTRDMKVDCSAHSVEYNVASNSVRPLTVRTDVWCSSGSVLPDGRLVQTGGDRAGELKVRIIKTCSRCDWQEIDNGLLQPRWYATNHILPDGKIIIIGGRAQFNFEFYPKSTSPNAHSLPFLSQTNDQGIENNLYPFVFLNVDGNLFIFANNRAILLDYVKNKVIKTYPAIPGGDPRNYPSSGSAVLLPLKNLTASKIEAEVLVCGGAPKGSYNLAIQGTFVTALNTCARIKITDQNPQWIIETMPHARVMGDMILLPNGKVLIINGGSAGTSGWEIGRNPVLSPDIYKPDNPLGDRFETQNPTTIPRMYHSTAVLLRDGRVLIGGSNAHEYYNFTGVLFPTELSLEAFSPDYLDGQFSNMRPNIRSPRTQTRIKYNKTFEMKFTVTGTLNRNFVEVTMVAPSFTTHSFSMNQRLLVLESRKLSSLGSRNLYSMEVTAPKSAQLAPPGYYLMFVVHRDIPSEGIWVHVN